MSNQFLKPCPACGKPVEIVRIGGGWFWRHKDNPEENECVMRHARKYDTEEKAVAAWNGPKTNGVQSVEEQLTPEIKDYNVYTARMQKSVYDKMFFVDKIFDSHIDTFLDFGCGDGELMRCLKEFMPNLRFVGYDINPTMIEKARINAPFAEYYSQWEDVKVNPNTTILNLSSVLHEVYTYSTPEELDTFWQRITIPGWAYITVRDMFKNPQNAMIDTTWKQIIRERGCASKLDDFERIWGPIQHVNDAIHFLLKYRYTENWEREVAENYLPMTPDDLANHLSNYQITWTSFESLPYIVHQVGVDFGINIQNIPTHLRVVFKKGVQYG